MLSQGQEDAVVRRDALAPAIRVVLGLFGLVPFLAPWELLIRPGHPFELTKLPFWFISAGAVSVGAVFLFASVLGPSETVEIDFRRGRLYRRSSVWGREWSREWSLEAIRSVDVVAVEFSDGPVSWNLELRVSGLARPIGFGRYADNAEAEACRSALVARLAALRRV